jgi:hypothetical protein
MHILFLFLDGVGLGENDLEHNPLAAAQMPNLYNLLGGRRLLRSSPPLETGRASLLSLDPNMNVGGLPQSATGQAALITGKNIPEMIGQHYGPKPNQEVRQILAQSNLFCTLKENGYQAALLNAYPDRYFEAIDSGKRLYSAIPQAVVNAQIPLKTKEDLYAGQALSGDFTGEVWRTFLNDTEVPLLTNQQAGERLAGLAGSLDFSFFEYWPSDYAGHRQDKTDAVNLLETFDQVLGSLLEHWDDSQGLILITSDHGNLEDISTRRHTDNPVPALVVGSPSLRRQFCEGLSTLADITPAILQFFPPKS